MTIKEQIDAALGPIFIKLGLKADPAASASAGTMPATSAAATTPPEGTPVPAAAGAVPPVKTETPVPAAASAAPNIAAELNAAIAPLLAKIAALEQGQKSTAQVAREALAGQGVPSAVLPQQTNSAGTAADPREAAMAKYNELHAQSPIEGAKFLRANEKLIFGRE